MKGKFSMSSSYNVVRNFSESARVAIERMGRSEHSHNIEFDGNVIGEFAGKNGILIRKIVKPNGSYAIKTFAPQYSGNALCSEYDNGVFRDLLKTIEMKVADAKSGFDILQIQDFSGDFSTFKQYIRKKGEKFWTVAKRIL